ncbi:hypothetical protein G6F36_015708 [Rhizopus arrhizus]|nr:hypothetical protein G6F36_015708 [Rhizopus arrhizus]
MQENDACEAAQQTIDGYRSAHDSKEPAPTLETSKKQRELARPLVSFQELRTCQPLFAVCSTQHGQEIGLKGDRESQTQNQKAHHPPHTGGCLGIQAIDRILQSSRVTYRLAFSQDRSRSGLPVTQTLIELDLDRVQGHAHHLLNPIVLLLNPVVQTITDPLQTLGPIAQKGI